PDDSGDPPGTPPSSPKPPLPAAPVPPSISPKSAEPPKASDIPKPTQESTLAQEPTTPRDLGRGGELHKSIQERLQAEARALGFLAEVEKQVSGDSNQAADLLLRRGELRIAVEIALTTTTNQEFGNVKKNLDAGFERVAVVAIKQERLEQIAAAVRAGLSPESAAKVGYYSPDDFISELRRLVESAGPLPGPTNEEHRTRGYKVRRHGPELSLEERKAKETTAIQVIAKAMR